MKGRWKRISLFSSITPDISCSFFKLPRVIENNWKREIIPYQVHQQIFPGPMNKFRFGPEFSLLNWIWPFCFYGITTRFCLQSVTTFHFDFHTLYHWTKMTKLSFIYLSIIESIRGDCFVMHQAISVFKRIQYISLQNAWITSCKKHRDSIFYENG